MRRRRDEHGARTRRAAARLAACSSFVVHQGRLLEGRGGPAKTGREKQKLVRREGLRCGPLAACNRSVMRATDLCVDSSALSLRPTGDRLADLSMMGTLVRPNRLG